MKTPMKTTWIVGTAMVLGSLPLVAQMCCGHGSNAESCCPSALTATASGKHSGHSATSSETIAAAPVRLEGTAKVVFESYLFIQTALARDSIEEVASNAESIFRAISADKGNAFPSQIAGQANRLMQAKDLAAARAAFRTLSHSLVRYVKAGKVPAGVLFEVYCPMAMASWLQTDKTVRNPYFGRSMQVCGQVRG